MRYNKTAVDDLMHPETRKVTILRDPMANFMSSWKLRAKIIIFLMCEKKYYPGSIVLSWTNERNA